MASVNLQKISKKFGDTSVLESIDLDIKDGEFVVFVGPSGCGKSTLLRIVAGLTDVTDGDISIGDTRMNDIPPAERGIAMVFQSYALYPHMTVEQNMSFSLRMAKQPKEQINEKVLDAARILQLEQLLDRKPGALSGGQRQRVAIGRAIVRQPQVFLFDEPLSNLDAELRVDMRVQIAKLHKQLNTTMIYVTHDQVEAMTMADQIVVLNAGYLQQVGSPLELYHYPCNRFVAGFIGSPKMNFISVKYAGGDAKQTRVKLGRQQATLPVVPGPGNATKNAYKVGDELTLGIRPKHLNVLGKGVLTFPGEAEVVEKLGGLSYVYVHLKGNATQFTAEIGDDLDFDAGKKITLGVSAEDCHLFDTNGTAFRRLTKLATK